MSRDVVGGPTRDVTRELAQMKAKNPTVEGDTLTFQTEEGYGWLFLSDAVMTWLKENPKVEVRAVVPYFTFHVASPHGMLDVKKIVVLTK